MTGKNSARFGSACLLAIVVLSATLIAAGCRSVRSDSLIVSRRVARVIRAVRAALGRNDFSDVEKSAGANPIVWTGVIESELLAARDTATGDRLCTLLGRVGMPASIPAILNYCLRREALSDVDVVEYEPTADMLREAKKLNFSDIAENSIVRIGLRNNRVGEVLAQLGICLHVYHRYEDVQFVIACSVRELIYKLDLKSGAESELRLKLGSELGIQAIEGIISDGLEYSIADTDLDNPLDLLIHAPTKRSLEIAIQYVLDAKNFNLAREVWNMAHRYLLPKEGPYKGLKDEKLDAWLKDSLSGWWRLNRKRIRYNEQEARFELHDR